jgi:uncharacterized membrane protein YcgQ (UPF0703/DUF1980 family)
VSFYVLWKQHKPLYWLILVLALFVPFFFAESYLVGFYMPFAWFIYYVTTPLAILAAVVLVFVFDKTYAYYHNHRSLSKKLWVKVTTVLLIVALGAAIVYRSDVVYGKTASSRGYIGANPNKLKIVGDPLALPRRSELFH